MSDVRTHHGIDPTLVGVPEHLEEGVARARLLTTPEMAADDRGLVHGGFIFGLADYAAMLAVNDPHVVLGGAEVRFTRPVTVQETVVAEARVTEERGRKRVVEATVSRGEDTVFRATFTCFVLDRHVLDG